MFPRGARRAAEPCWLVIVSIIAPMLAAPVARADVELDRSGETGRHRLVDMYDSPGAVCDIVLPGLESLGETWLRVNPPVMFARDRTPEIDEQYVGWRAAVSARNDRTDDWQVVRRSGATRAMASDNRTSYFNGQGWLAGFPVSRATYTVTVEMLWYAPDDSRHVVGRAVDSVEHYSILLRHDGEILFGRTASACRAPR